MKLPARLAPLVARALAPALALALVGSTGLRAQDQDHGAWFAVAGQGHWDRRNPAARWRWWFDGHARFFEGSDGFAQSIVRPGLGYDVSRESTVWLGYAWIVDDPADVPAFDEHRIWQQLTWGRTVGAHSWFARSRLEQRFVETGDDLGWRFRQFLRWTRPFAPEGRHGVRLWDELFFDLNDTDWGADTGFSQNRLFAGLGWTLDDQRHVTLEYGYLNQYLPRSGADDALNHVLGFTLLLSY